MHPENPLPKNELERLLKLSELDLDYRGFRESFQDLTKLAAKVAGTEISLINLIDSYTQWSVSSFGIDLEQMPREDSVCQYTLAVADDVQGFEIKNLAADERFKDKFYVKSDPNLTYYFGVPLKMGDQINLGALCVLDKEYQEITPEKKEMLELIAGEVVNRIRIHFAINQLQSKISESNQVKNKVAHDIRGPIGGIIGLAEIIQMQGDSNKLEEVLDFIKLIQKSGKSVLELADEILSQDYGKEKKKLPSAQELTLELLEDKLRDMYAPQAISKSIKLEVNYKEENADIPFPKNKLMQILGNLISNALKFTPPEGKVTVSMEMEVLDLDRILRFEVADTGTGMSEAKITEILEGRAESTQGTGNETGFGFGLNLVIHLIQSLKGKLEIESKPGEGSIFKITIPIKG
ncbi:GAF domain-containing sensor histidine kinase [Algoriphagus sp.]|uniref:GAF domain-containing sensor histidine kinase n=1 Tax=Algoriphagus sp. TaxID=1872435 RepID=UPI00262B2094|nr:GAF domain-containing sensor histidine kinase [Algoriphagus sp.]